MSLYESDLEEVIKYFDFFELKDIKILVTGSTGLICSAVIDILLKIGATVYAAGRNKEKILKRFNGKINFVKYDASLPLHFEQYVDYIIHGASIASPDEYLKSPVETMISNFIGMNNLMQYAVKHKVKKILYISSSEVYGNNNNAPYKEDAYGLIDILNPRSCYPASKQATETLCTSYGKEYNVNFSIVRPGHIYGPTAVESDQRVSSLFIRQAAHRQNIILKSNGSQIRSYCYCVDCASAILTVMKKGVSGKAYNISNRNSIISIRELATMIAQIANVDLVISEPSLKERKAFNQMQNSSLDSSEIEKLGWKGLYNAYIGLEHTIQTIRGDIIDL